MIAAASPLVGYDSAGSGLLLSSTYNWSEEIDMMRLASSVLTSIFVPISALLRAAAAALILSVPLAYASACAFIC